MNGMACSSNRRCFSGSTALLLGFGFAALGARALPSPAAALFVSVLRAIASLLGPRVPYSPRRTSSCRLPWPDRRGRLERCPREPERVDVLHLRQLRTFERAAQRAPLERPNAPRFPVFDHPAAGCEMQRRPS